MWIITSFLARFSHVITLRSALSGDAMIPTSRNGLAALLGFPVSRQDREGLHSAGAFDKGCHSRYSWPMKVQLIYNPVAGRRDIKDDLLRVRSFLQSKGWEVALRSTMGPGDATTYAREAVATQCDMAVAVGGDGTLGEVANGLVGSDCIMGVLPIGTGNVWAHMMDLPLWTPVSRSALLDAAQVLVDGQVHEIDLG